METVGNVIWQTDVPAVSERSLEERDGAVVVACLDGEESQIQGHHDGVGVVCRFKVDESLFVGLLRLSQLACRLAGVPERDERPTNAGCVGELAEDRESLVDPRNRRCHVTAVDQLLGHGDKTLSLG